jgi:hypothetical protein
VILKTLLFCNNTGRYRHLLDATKHLFFFGAPHRGLRTDELEKMADDLGVGEASVARLVQLREGSELLEELREFLAENGSRFEVTSFYETQKSPTVHKVSTQTFF